MLLKSAFCPCFIASKPSNVKRLNVDNSRLFQWSVYFDRVVLIDNSRHLSKKSHCMLLVKSFRQKYILHHDYAQSSVVIATTGLCLDAPSPQPGAVYQCFSVFFRPA